MSAIDAYAGRGAPHRPFVLTCRTTDYQQIGADLVRDDQRVELVGMQRDQIRARLDEQTAGRPAWDELRRSQTAGQNTLNELFESPLRLAIALQVGFPVVTEQERTLSGFAEPASRMAALLMATGRDAVVARRRPCFPCDARSHTVLQSAVSGSPSKSAVTATKRVRP